MIRLGARLRMTQAEADAFRDRTGETSIPRTVDEHDRVFDALAARWRAQGMVATDRQTAAECFLMAVVEEAFRIEEADVEEEGKREGQEDPWMARWRRQRWRNTGAPSSGDPR